VGVVGAEDADLFGFAADGADVLDGFLLRLPVLRVAPFADRDEVLLQAFDRIAERPGAAFVGGAIAGGIVGGGMGSAAIGEVFDERGAEIGARALGGPLGDGVDGEEVVAVDAHGRHAVADRARGEGGVLAAGDTLERRDRPLIVDDVNDDGRLVDVGEGHGGVEVAFGGRTFAEPGGGEAHVA
jgi:hypothetical protein